jgi:hypothetical protein
MFTAVTHFALLVAWRNFHHTEWAAFLLELCAVDRVVAVLLDWSSRDCSDCRKAKCNQVDVELHVVLEQTLVEPKKDRNSDLHLS